jgi:hypothetical protein
VGNLATKSEILERGVYEADYLVGGHQVLVAIDSRGNARKHVKLTPGVSYARAKAWLEQLLDRIDPPLELRLVRGGGAPPPAPARAASDAVRDGRPTHADDRRLYTRRLARAAAARLRVFRD